MSQPQQPPAPAQNGADFAQTCAEVAERSSRLLSGHVRRQMAKGFTAPSDELGIAKAFMDMMSLLMANPQHLAQAQMNLVRDYMALWQQSMLGFMGLQAPAVVTPKKGDNRFKDPHWEEHFLFDFVKQSYLITARHVHDTVGSVEGLSDTSRKKVNFFTRQFIDALAPTNFALTNPEVLREITKTRGRNLLQGLSNLLRDIEEGDGQLRVKMTDHSAFELGVNVGVTPGKVVFQNEMMQLLQFNPTTKQQYRRPLLIVPPWINKYYILDLKQSNSFIKWATDQGHTVFCISWVNPDRRLAEKQFEDYMTEGLLAALDAVEAQCGVKEMNLIGYCLGGTLLGATMAWLAARKDKRVASATFFVSLLDFSIPGELGVFIDEGQVASLEKKMSERGYLEGSEMAGTFNMLRSNDLIWSFVVNNYLMGKEPFPFDLLFWNSDATRMPYRMHSFYLRNMYMANLLRVPGGITLAGVPIDLAQVKTPCYFISTAEDHIAPWKGTYLGATALGGPVRFVLGGSGHIAGIINPPAANKYGYWTHPAAQLPADPDAWMAAAEQHEGSWWTDWQAWVTAHDSRQVPARHPAKGRLPALEDAPGSFVKLRLDVQKTPATPHPALTK